MICLSSAGHSGACAAEPSGFVSSGLSILIKTNFINTRHLVKEIYLKNEMILFKPNKHFIWGNNFQAR